MARRGYPPEFRRRVVDLVEAGRKVSEVASKLEVSEQTIYRLVARTTDSAPLAFGRCRSGVAVGLANRIGRGLRLDGLPPAVCSRADLPYTILLTVKVSSMNVHARKSHGDGDSTLGVEDDFESARRSLVRVRGLLVLRTVAMGRRMVRWLRKACSRHDQRRQDNRRSDEKTAHGSLLLRSHPDRQFEAPT